MRYYQKNEYPEVVRETDVYVDYALHSMYGGGKTRETKGMCVGGPLDGEVLTETQIKHAAPWGYSRFNRDGYAPTRHKFIFAWIGDR